MKKWLWILIILTVWMLPSVLMADDTDEMVVTASRVKEKKKEVTQTVQTIDKIEIEASGASGLADLLAEKGIGHIHKYPSGNTSVGIRGFRTDPHGNDLNGNILILLNGRRAGTGNLTKFMTKNIERVEIIRGPGAVQYGSAGMGGVINVITKQGTDNFEGFVEAGFGSYSHNEQSVGLSGKSGKFDYSAAITRLDKDDYKTVNDGDYANTNIDDQINASINLGYEFAPDNRIGLIYNFYDVETGNWSSLAYNSANDDYTEKDNASLDLIYDGATETKSYTWRLRYFNGEDNNNYYYPDSGKDASETETDQNGIQAQVTGNFGLSQLTLGTDWVNYDINASGVASEYDNKALFALGKTRLLGERLILSGGVRLDDYEIEGNGTEKSDDDVTFNLGTAYLLTDNWKIRLNFGQAFVMPTAEQLLIDMSYSGGFYIYEANPNLNPERSQTYEAGIEYESLLTRAGLTAFYTDYKDKIVSAYSRTVGMSNYYSYSNVNEATISGIEGTLSFDMGGLLGWGLEVRPFANFVYLNEYEDGDTGKDLLYTSDMTISAGLRVADPDLFNVNLVITHTGEQDINVYNAVAMATERVTKKDFTVTNLTGNYKIFQQENGNALWVHGEVNNLFDKDYEYINGYPMAGRNFFASLKYAF
ncbi:MAG: TonB-dependent receptor [Desulfobacter sp.]|nr:MAG: TonB-dependent receptor [Desulfobacter sp.]